MRGDAGASLFPLPGSFQKKLSHPAGARRLHEIEKRAVFESPAAAAVLFPARQELPHERCPHQSGHGRQVLQQGDFFLLQVRGGHLPQIQCLNHNNS